MRALVNLDDALQRLEVLDPRQGEIVEQRYFGGLSLEETAEALGVSLATVKRELRFAQPGWPRNWGRHPGTARESLVRAEGSVLGDRRQRARRTSAPAWGPCLDRPGAASPRPRRCSPPTVAASRYWTFPGRAAGTSTPARVGPYEIVDVLGAGGMGQVYRARDSRLQRDVAIKVLPAAVSSDAGRLARFEREAQLLASLNHPHIAQVYGLEDASGTPALVMELVEGSTLAHLIAGCRGRLSRWPGSSRSPARLLTDWMRRTRRGSSTAI